MKKQTLTEKRKLIAKLVDEDPELKNTILPELFKTLAKGKFAKSNMPVEDDDVVIGKAGKLFRALYSLSGTHERAETEILSKYTTPEKAGNENSLPDISPEDYRELALIRRAQDAVQGLMADIITREFDDSRITTGMANIILKKGDVLTLTHLSIEELVAITTQATTPEDTGEHVTDAVLSNMGAAGNA